MLQTAQHADPTAFWHGARYELNITFERLLDLDWEQVLSTLWHDTRLYGPLVSRPTPFAEMPQLITQRYPGVTDMLTQHGLFTIGEITVGCDVQSSRTLFESVSIQIPLSMFAGFTDVQVSVHNHPELAAIDAIFYEMALDVFAVQPFQIAAIGVERGPQTLFELTNNPQARHDLLLHGNFFAHDHFLGAIEPDLQGYEVVRDGLKFKPRQQIG